MRERTGTTRARRVVVVVVYLGIRHELKTDASSLASQVERTKNERKTNEKRTKTNENERKRTKTNEGLELGVGVGALCDEGSPRSRHTLRVVPVDTVCYAGVEEIKKAMTPIIAKYFPSPGGGAAAAAKEGGGEEGAAADGKGKAKEDGESAAAAAAAAGAAGKTAEAGLVPIHTIHTVLTVLTSFTCISRRPTAFFF